MMPQKNSKTALIVGTQSGCGKTTVMLALLQFLKPHFVQTFKAGPDYLDPFWHQAMTSRACYNLDTKMMGKDLCREQFGRLDTQTEFVLIEGAMGLFDGAQGVGELGSSAHLAKVLDVPVLLVVNVKGMAGSIVPLVKGFCEMAKSLGVVISGIIANHVGSDHHVKLLVDLLNTHHLPPMVGWMKKNAPILPERHLGLKRPNVNELPNFSDFFQVNEKALFSAFKTQAKKTITPQKPLPLLNGKIIAVTYDDACCFIYPANLDWLKTMGATVVFFSILNGDVVPKKADALWLTGGYPELYGHLLEKSNSWDSIKKFIEADKPVLAECGGVMLLGKTLIDLDGKSYKMAGILPFSSVMKDHLVSLGYRHEKSGVKGHEFHHSARIEAENLVPCFSINRGDSGIRYKKLRASYIHWYFASAPEIIAGWLS